ncbi:MAG: hypothetical protein ACI85O_001262 [Saprospiraceae bacterium]
MRKLSTEIAKIQENLENSQRCEVELLPAATFERIRNKFNQYGSRIKVFHYSGHANDFGLLLNEKKGSTNLSSWLNGQTDLRLIFLNACSTLPQIKEFSGTNQCTFIATTNKVKDSAAHDFSIGFYEAFSFGNSVKYAFGKAELLVRNNFPNNKYRELNLDEEQEEEQQLGNKERPWRLLPESGGAFKLENTLSTAKADIHFYKECDREEQFAKFEELWDRKFLELPNIYFLAGDADSKTDSFIDRIWKIAQEKKTKDSKLKVTYKKLGTFPDERRGGRYRKVLQQTFAAFDLDEEENLSTNNAEAIIKYISPNSITILEKEIKLYMWNEETVSCLQEYIEIFWNVPIENAAKQNKHILLIFNVVVHDKNLWERLKERFLEGNRMSKFLKREPTTNQVFLPRFDKVHIRDVKVFTRKFPFATKIEQVFQGKEFGFLPKKKWRMSIVEEKLKELHEKFGKT